jgi:hypothetical protein
MLDELNAQGQQAPVYRECSVCVLQCARWSNISFQSSNTRCFIRLFFCKLQLLFAASPLIALAYVLMSAFESEEAEGNKRKKKTDFQMDGHSE